MIIAECVRRRGRTATTLRRIRKCRAAGVEAATKPAKPTHGGGEQTSARREPAQSHLAAPQRWHSGIPATGSVFFFGFAFAAFSGARSCKSLTAHNGLLVSAADSHGRLAEALLHQGGKRTRRTWRAYNNHKSPIDLLSDEGNRTGPPKTIASGHEIVGAVTTAHLVRPPQPASAALSSVHRRRCRPPPPRPRPPAPPR